MAKTPKERGKAVIAIEFDTKVLKRLRADAKADQRSVGFLVRQMVARHYAEIDDLRSKHLNAPLSQPDRSVVFSREDTTLGTLLGEAAASLPPAKTKDRKL